MRRVDCVDGSQEGLLLPNVVGEEFDPSSGRAYYEIRTPRVVEVLRNHFDCMTMTGARLEARRGGLGCFGGFLDERLFFGEQVSGFQVTSRKNGGASISPLTLALLEDSSWYVGNYTTSTEMPFGRGAGCQFAHGACAVDGSGQVQVSAEAKGFHCAEIGSMGCDVTHSSKAKCDLLHSNTATFIHDMFGSETSLPDNTDVCPMHVRGAVNCVSGTKSPSSSMLPGEVYGAKSKCFMTDDGQPICLQGMCNEETQGVDVWYEEHVFACTRDGEIIDTKKGVRIECPRIAAVCPHLICPSNCSGRGVCDQDWDGKHTCICDDPFDDTPGCWNS